MNNPLKRQPSNGDTIDPQYKDKRKKLLYTDDFQSTSLKPYADHHYLPASHLPPSPPIIVDTPAPAPSPLPTSSIQTPDSIPTMKRFTITTRHHHEHRHHHHHHHHQQQQQQKHREYTLSDYASINQVLHEAHVQRHGDPSVPRDSDMMDCDDSNYYDYANTILRQAFLQRHSSPPT